jgi:DNA-3-methyladenine glycosylase I
VDTLNSTGERARCEWSGSDPLYVEYHDHEWGVPSHDDVHLFEMLILDGAQAGLSWLTILRKRPGYRAAFAGFDVNSVARFGPADVDRLMSDPGIVRNRAKIESAIGNARATLGVVEEFGSLEKYLWRYVDGRPLQNRWRSLSEIPAQTELSKALSKDLLARGFKFVGPTIVYAMMQAVGIVNDHTLSCYRHAELAALAAKSQ